MAMRYVPGFVFSYTPACGIHQFAIILEAKGDAFGHKLLRVAHMTGLPTLLFNSLTALLNTGVFGGFEGAGNLGTNGVEINVGHTR